MAYMTKIDHTKYLVDDLLLYDDFADVLGVREKNVFEGRLQAKTFKEIARANRIKPELAKELFARSISKMRKEQWKNNKGVISWH